MKLKGLISLPPKGYDRTVSITCCNQQPNILIDGKSLYETLQQDSGCHSPPSREDVDEKDQEPEMEKKWRVRYVTRAIPFESEDDFETLAATAQTMELESSVDRGCYSEWTCGTGGYEFLLTGGHSILKELESYIGQYVWLELT